MPKTTKIQTLRNLLSSDAGASLDALCTATGWQPHSVRAALSGLRKTGFVILRETAAGDGAAGAATYRITATPGASA